jgi:hypothetical protein
MPTSKRSQINFARYPRIPSKILKNASREEVFNDVIAEVAIAGLVNDETRNLLILYVWSVETSRYLA